MTKVILLNDIEKPRPSLPIKQQRGYCTHKQVEVDIDEKELRCMNCNAVIYPFDYVRSLAYDERTLLHDFSELRRQIQELREQKEVLERDVKNLKLAKRRHS